MLGIRRETKSPFERRAPLTPEAVGRLVRDHGIRVLVERSERRAFPDAAYAEAGAELVDDAFGADVVIGVKEFPVDLLREGGHYAFFSHTIKGQPHNMPLLRRLLERGCSLVDHEAITDDRGNRLVFFSWHAGVAGMVDTLWTWGRREALRGRPNPFSELERAWEYGSIRAIDEALERVGERIRRDGLERPLVVAIAGGGRVARGAHRVLDRLPVERVAPSELPGLPRTGRVHHVTKVALRVWHLFEPIDPGVLFERDEFHAHPERYRAVFHRFLPYIDVLVNGLFWNERTPRILPLDLLREAWSRPDEPRLQVVGDVSCDVGGGIQCLVRTTGPGAPSYVYDPRNCEVHDDLAAPGLALMAVDHLPCEVPVEASEHFSGALEPLVPGLVSADWSAPLERLDLPAPLRRALVCHRGALTPEFRHLEAPLREHG